jgi:hypothetical protein
VKTIRSCGIEQSRPPKDCQAERAKSGLSRMLIELLHGKHIIPGCVGSRSLANCAGGASRALQLICRPYAWRDGMRHPDESPGR